ncbi:hypothetical protein B9J87_07250 [Vibrio sp. V19_P1S1T109]|nr:DUF2066 domain-containing protein [Vibrio sp. V22_P2S10T140]OXX50204.1 hypothetical protein B9J83_00440 [Vibrio sp. V07_P2A8T137]OXX63573.1 hypothetical protein B9J82_04210 [Vibrio sp. V10_P2A27P122]OXX70678.1 hypothetical protein B9J84_09380 [Vibrio sp. V03_P4A6T147]OXX72935.1 hypothetical protein B9J87_07250 [Vibrio sp. V19_P1S1T109]PSD42314.1 DUF2066 domain-containing protein [Vibrio sp. V02_P2A34T13]
MLIIDVHKTDHRNSMRYLAMLVMSLLTLPAYALTKVDLYHTEVVIDQQQDNADANARIKGMSEVIVRASGDRNAVNNEVIQKALRQNSQYLAQISYGQNGAQSSIVMGFSAPHIRTLLTQAQLPFWPENRANVLVWLIEESGYDRSIAWEHSDTSTLKQLKGATQTRGLPITVPVGDFDDITGVEVSDLWGGFVQPISMASQRYPTDAVLVVRVQSNGVRWSLYDQPAAQMTQATKAPLSGQASGDDAIEQMVDQLSDYYARKSSVIVASESSSSLLARFSPIDDAMDFFTLENKLKRLSSVASLDILKIQGEEITFEVHLLASESEFEQEVLRMGKVAKIDDPQPESVPIQLTPAAEVDDSAVESGSLQVTTEPSLSQAITEPVKRVLSFEWQA